jgi:hypothetical protein
MSTAETEAMNTEEKDIPRSAPPGVRTALRDPNLQIRLLLLDAAGPDENTISASLEIWDKESAPPFNAISYVCGDAQQMQDVTVNGSRVSVRHNCYYALWQTRLHFPESRVWIDAICINQLDLEEKTAQVTMMFEIYSKAAQVLACIGPSDWHSDITIQAMDHLDAVVQDLPREWLEKPLNMDFWDPPLDEAAAAQLYDHYQEFCMRPYFTRVWVVQELAGGRNRTKLLCGQEISDWSDLDELSWRFKKMYLHQDGPCKGHPDSSICDISMLTLEGFHNGCNFPRYLLRLQELHCQDVRDRIYSTHALVNWSSFDQTPPVPDYQISSLELALQLVDKMPDTSLSGIRIIAKALGLLNPPIRSQVLQELREHQKRAKSYNAPDVRYRKWCAVLVGVQMVQQNDTGRPMVLLDRHVPKELTASSEVATRTNFSGLTEDMLAACRLIPIYDANGVLAALLSERMRPGDIIVHSRWFGMVLRPHDDSNKFIVVGRTLFSAGIGLAREAPFADECDRHRLQRAHYTPEWIKIAIELSDVEALEVVVSGDNLSNVDCDGPESLERCTLGETKAGSHVWDVTAEKFGYVHSAEMMGQLPCSSHRAGDYYWKYQKFLWYSVLMGTGGVLTFPKKTDRRRNAE